MKSGSMASYRAAMPSECFGEPDDEPEQKPSREPIAFIVVWFTPVFWVEPQEWYDAETDTYQTEMTRMDMLAPVFRVFAADAHGSAALALKAADRWRDAMIRKHGARNVDQLRYSDEVE